MIIIDGFNLATRKHSNGQARAFKKLVVKDQGHRIEKPLLSFSRGLPEDSKDADWDDSFMHLL